MVTQRRIRLENNGTSGRTGFRVIAIDLLGFGYSEKPKWFDYSIQSQARMISRFMDRQGIGRAIVAGSSYGGAVAATLALDYAQRVEKLVLVDAVINDGVKSHPILKLLRSGGWRKYLRFVRLKAFLRYRSTNLAKVTVICHQRQDRLDSRPCAADGTTHARDIAKFRDRKRRTHP